MRGRWSFAVGGRIDRPFACPGIQCRFDQVAAAKSPGGVGNFAGEGSFDDSLWLVRAARVVKDYG